MHQGFWLENLKEEGSFEDLDRDGSIILKLILNKQIGRLWNGFVRLRIGASEELFCEILMNFGAV